MAWAAGLSRKLKFETWSLKPEMLEQRVHRWSESWTDQSIKALLHRFLWLELNPGLMLHSTCLVSAMLQAGMIFYLSLFDVRRGKCINSRPNLFSDPCAAMLRWHLSVMGGEPHCWDAYLESEVDGAFYLAFTGQGWWIASCNLAPNTALHHYQRTVEQHCG